MENIQITEKQAREILQISINGFSDNGFKESITRLKQAGYIKKNPVEEAEDKYRQFVLYGYGLNSAKNLIKKQHEAIQYLKSEIERIKEK